MFSSERFINEAIPRISPLNQFKVLQNMPLSFISIVFNLTGTNAVVYSSASGLLLQVIYSVTSGDILLGASKTYTSGKVEIGFALVNRNEIDENLLDSFQGEAIEIFREWYTKNHA